MDTLSVFTANMTGSEDSPQQYNLEKEAKNSNRAEYRRKIEALLDADTHPAKRQTKDDLDDLLMF